MVLLAGNQFLASNAVMALLFEIEPPWNTHLKRDKYRLAQECTIWLFSIPPPPTNLSVANYWIHNSFNCNPQHQGILKSSLTNYSCLYPPAIVGVYHWLAKANLRLIASHFKSTLRLSITSWSKLYSHKNLNFKGYVPCYFVQRQTNKQISWTSCDLIFICSQFI